MKFKLVFTVLGLSILTIFSSFRAKNSEMKLIAKSLPNITLEDVDGNKVNVSEIGKSGKVTVISFWATWCTPCKKELNNMIEMTNEWKQKGNVDVYAITIDDSRAKPKIKGYIDGQKWPYKILLDVNQDLKRALNFQTVPYTIIIDKSGNIVETHNGYVEGDEFELQEKVEKLLAQ